MSPTYTYYCRDCGCSYELYLPMEHEKQYCLQCEAELVQRLHPPLVKFEGSGWQTRKPVKEGEK